MTSRRRDQAGVATVLATAVVTGLASVAVGGVLVGGVLVARHRAQSGADLVALAVAGAQARGEDGCVRAAAAARRNEVRLVRCAEAGADVVVEVAVPVSLLRGVSVDVPAVARAGPSGS